MLVDGWGDLERELSRLAALTRRLQYVPNDGNAGDALIGAGTWQLFDDQKIRPRVSSIHAIRRGDVAIFGGGGNLVPEYGHCRAFLERCLEVGVRAAVVLPQSVRGHEALLRRLDGGYTIFCRERASYERVRATLTGARVLLAPDLALRVDVERLFSRCRERGARLSLARELVFAGKLKDYRLWRLALEGVEVGPARTLRVIRTDLEAVPHVRGEPRGDISDFYGSKFRSRREMEFVARDLLAFVGRARDVVTNRLHVGIAAALVGRPVAFVDNSYGKIKAVYEHSLRGQDRISFETLQPVAAVT